MRALATLPFVACLLERGEPIGSERCFRRQRDQGCFCMKAVAVLVALGPHFAATGAKQFDERFRDRQALDRLIARAAAMRNEPPARRYAGPALEHVRPPAAPPEPETTNTPAPPAEPAPLQAPATEGAPMAKRICVQCEKGITGRAPANEDGPPMHPACRKGIGAPGKKVKVNGAAAEHAGEIDVESTLRKQLEFHRGRMAELQHHSEQAAKIERMLEAAGES